MKEALIIVDVQNDYFPNGKFPTWNPEETAKNCAILLEKFRKEGKEIVHVAHEMPPEFEQAVGFLHKGTPGAEIHESVKPHPSEKVIIKNYTSSFIKTDLNEYLKSKGVDTIIVVGMMMHNCVNGTVYSGTDAGFQCIVVDEAVNSVDQKLHDEVVKAEDIKKGFLAGVQFYYAKVKKVQDILDNNY